jgi:hypothetical protein
MSNSKESKKLKNITVNVFQLEPHADYARFNKKGYVKYGDDFDDEVYDLKFLDNNKNNTLTVDNNKVQLTNDIFFQFYKDNIPETYIIKTTKIPVFHCAVMFARKILLSNLLNIYLYFNIQNTKSYKSFHQLSSSNLKGTYELVLEYNGNQQNLPFSKFISLEDLTLDILKLLQSDLVRELINDIIEVNNEECVKKYGKMDDHEVPTNIINFKNLVEKYKTTNGNMDDVMNLYNK